ncbi:MAG: hypothetical protein JXA77_11125 [Bacteroidales bacterium]|nr:hypothetical protein [Bacteroidales bacterium]MBN2819044.1 hypothetical protein [Bacteroidales bacterium]
MLRNGYKIVFFIALISGIPLYCQFSTPIAPADTHEYFNYARIIRQHGCQIRKDHNYIVQGGNVTNDEYTSRIIKYSTKGFIQEITYLDKSSQKLSVISFQYKNGLPYRETEFLTNGEVVGHTVYTYDSLGFLKEKVNYDQFDYVIYKLVYETDTMNNVIVLKQFYSPGNISKTYIYTYSDLICGRLQSIIEYDGEAFFKYRKEFAYNSENLLEKEIILDINNNTEYLLERFYDANGMLEKIDRVLAGEERFPWYNSQYSAEGLLLGEIKYSSRGNIISYFKYSYY